jgi:hypothetical protein
MNHPLQATSTLYSLTLIVGLSCGGTAVIDAGDTGTASGGTNSTTANGSSTGGNGQGAASPTTVGPGGAGQGGASTANVCEAMCDHAEGNCGIADACELFGPLLVINLDDCDARAQCYSQCLLSADCAELVALATQNPAPSLAACLLNC